MALNITKTNTKVIGLGGGWVKVIHDTGAKDAEGKPITIEATTSRSAIEVSEGVFLPKAWLRVVLAEELGRKVQLAEVELNIL